MTITVKAIQTEWDRAELQRAARTMRAVRRAHQAALSCYTCGAVLSNGECRRILYDSAGNGPLCGQCGGEE